MRCRIQGPNTGVYRSLAHELSPPNAPRSRPLRASQSSSSPCPPAWSPASSPWPVADNNNTNPAALRVVVCGGGMFQASVTRFKAEARFSAAKTSEVKDPRFMTPTTQGTQKPSAIGWENSGKTPAQRPFVALPLHGHAQRSTYNVQKS